MGCRRERRRRRFADGSHHADRNETESDGLADPATRDARSRLARDGGYGGRDDRVFPSLASDLCRKE